MALPYLIDGNLSKKENLFKQAYSLFSRMSQLYVSVYREYRSDIAIRPGGDDPLSFQVTEMLVQFAAKLLILVNRGNKDLSYHTILPVDSQLSSLCSCLCVPPVTLLV